MLESEGDLKVDEERDPIEQLAESFLERRRRGESISVRQFAELHPSFTDRILELFPTLLLMEEWKPDGPSRSSGGASVAQIKLSVERIGDYRVIREIGRGGMGVVYEAEQESLRRRVALKVLPANHVASPHRLQRFVREAQAAARLHHTNIVPVFDVGHENGLYYFVMQFIAGVGLDQVVQALTDPSGADRPRPSRPDLITEVFPSRESPPVSDEPAVERESTASGERTESGRDTLADFSLSAAVRLLLSGPSLGGDIVSDTTPSVSDAGKPWMAKLTNSYWQNVAKLGIQGAEALEYAHRQGTLHRDVKPANLILDNAGTLWIADFGLAKVTEFDDLTQPGDVVGTLRYMAPEQFEGKVDARSDVYGLGLTLYELIALRPAFDEKDRRRLIRQVTQEDPPPPRRFQAAVPRDLETIVLKAIASHPEHRYQTAGDLAEDLRRFIEDRPILARPITLTGRLWRWCRRNRATALLAGAALSLLITIAVVASAGYLVTNRALEQASAEHGRAEEALQTARSEFERAEANLRLAMKAFDDVFARVAFEPVALVSDSSEDDDDDLWQEASIQAFVTGKDAALLESMLKFYDQFAEQNQTNVSLRRESARAARRVGDIQRRLGQAEKAEAAYRRALGSYRDLAAADPNDAEPRIAQAAIQNDLGQLFRRENKFLEAAAAHRRAIEILRAESADVAKLPEWRFELSRTYASLSTVPGGPPMTKPDGPGPRFSGGWLKDRARDALDFNQRALDLLNGLIQESPDNAKYQFALARSQRDRSVLMSMEGKRSESDAARQTAIEILEKLSAAAPANSEYRYELLETLVMRLGPERGETAMPKQATAQLRRAVELGEELVRQYPLVREYQASLVRVRLRASEVARASGNLDSAEEQLGKVVASERPLLVDKNASQFDRMILDRSLTMLAEIQLSKQQPAKARANLEEVVAGFEKTPDKIGGGPGSTFGGGRFMQKPYSLLARAYRELGETALADKAEAKAASLAPPFGKPMEHHSPHHGRDKPSSKRPTAMKSPSSRPPSPPPGD